VAAARHQPSCAVERAAATPRRSPSTRGSPSPEQISWKPRSSVWNSRRKPLGPLRAACRDCVERCQRVSSDEAIASVLTARLEGAAIEQMLRMSCIDDRHQRVPRCGNLRRPAAASFASRLRDRKTRHAHRSHTASLSIIMPGFHREADGSRRAAPPTAAGRLPRPAPKFFQCTIGSAARLFRWSLAHTRLISNLTC